MQLSAESPRVRTVVIAGVWLLLVVLVAVHAGHVRTYLEIAGQLARRQAAVAPTPLAAAYPAFAADAQTWVRHALALVEGDDLRLRHTAIDNAPLGREVHWNSAWAWVIAGAGCLEHWISGAPLPRAMERAALWLNPVVLSTLTLLFGLWLGRRAGALAGVFTMIAIVGHPRVFEGFFPSYVDHHGLLCVAVLGLCLGGFLMGAGWWRTPAPGTRGILPATPEDARRAAGASALWGAFGMWISAASAIPPIAIVGAAGLAALLAGGRAAAAAGATFDPAVWRRWGRVGGGASFAFYLLEYFPLHLGLRLESNHPLYSLAWWSAGELIALVGTAWLGDRAHVFRAWRRWLLPAALLVLPAIVIAIGRESVFVVIDPFLAELHRAFIQEFQPLGRALRGMGWEALLFIVGIENIPLALAVAFLVAQRRHAPPILWFGAAALAGFTALAWFQSRWLLNAAGAQVALAVAVLAVVLQPARPWVRWVAGLAAAAALYGYPLATRLQGSAQDVALRRVSPRDATSALFRDVASAIRRSQPQGEITLLASPNSSTAVGYYGRFKTVGTLYWENTEGLKAAAAIFAAREPAEAARLIRERGITHIAMISEENFVAQYYTLLHPGATPDDIKKSFGHQLLVDRSIPPWLRILPYRVPDELLTLKIAVQLFQVAFDQTPADALYHLAVAKAATGAPAEAERDFDALIAEVPAAAEPRLRKSELLFARKEWAAAAETMIEGIRRAPAANRPALYESAGGSFYREGQPAQAAAIYRAALAETFNPTIAAYLAFILSTSPHDHLRDGLGALGLALRAVQAAPDSPTVLHAYAAALAENGRFPEAVAAAEKALLRAQAEGDAASARVGEQRLAAFRAGKPWRE